VGLYDITRKKAIHNNAVIPLLFFAVLVEAVFLLPVIVLSSVSPHFLTPLGIYIPPFGPLAHFCCFIKSIIVVSLWILGYFSVKHLPISIYAPIGASGPAWTLLGAMLVFGERLTPFQWAAFGVLFVSYYVFSLVGSREGIVFHTNKWVILLVLSVIIGSASALYDKYLVHTLGFSAVGVQVWFMMYSVLVMAFVLFAFWWPVRAKHTPFKWRWGILLIGALLAIADVAYFKAIGYPGAMISLVTAVRSGSVVISFLGGAFLFGEVQIRRKAIALVGVIIGVLMLLLSH
jgi:transporter family protein